MTNPVTVIPEEDTVANSPPLEEEDYEEQFIYSE